MTGEPADAGPTVRFTAYPSQADILQNAAALTRRSPVSLAIGAFASTVSIVAIALGAWPSVLLLLFGLALLTGYFSVPFVWWSIRQRSDLLLAPVHVEADREGLAVTTGAASARQTWAVYRRARETEQAFLFEIGTGAVVMIVKAGVSEADQNAFRGLLKDAGLIKPPPSLLGRLRPLLWIAVGVGAAAALMGGPRVLSSVNVTASMSISTSVQNDAVTITGTTDLPDGSQVAVEAIQQDEWDRANAAGLQPDTESSWERYATATVEGGRFSATFPLAGWPSGRGLAVAYFWMDSTQPDAAAERFGRNGERLRGPDVLDDKEYGPLLEVEVPFAIP